MRTTDRYGQRASRKKPTRDSTVSGNGNKFDEIYKQKIWSGKDGSVPLSGPGSLVESSLPVIDFINQGVANQQIGSILDLGCGDLTYISTIEHINSGLLLYTGVDVSDYILSENEKRYPWFNGKRMDITKPQAFDADLIIIKDILFHLTNEQITALFNNLTASRFNFCIVTTMNNRSNVARKLDPKHNYANVNIRVAPFFRNRYLQSLSRPRSANEGMKDQGEFLVYDLDTFNFTTRQSVIQPLAASGTTGLDITSEWVIDLE